jgi:glutathione S-transferase
MGPESAPDPGGRRARSACTLPIERRIGSSTQDAMITLHGFGRIFAEGIGETKDLWAQWVLEETGLPYRVHALDHGAGDLDADAYRRISPFRQVPVIDDDGFVVAESAAIALYLARKAGKLIPEDEHGRAVVTQWCFAAVGTVMPTLTCLDLIGMFDSGRAAPRLHEETRKLAGRWFVDVERRLQGREWIACAEFTVADILMAGVLRMVRKTDLMQPFPALRAYASRCLGRPAWQRTLGLYAERLGVGVDELR